LTNQLPIQQEDRTIIVDVLRGFALFGVLLGNFSSMLGNNVPQAMIDLKATGVDQFFNKLHDILIQNKFMTLFSILFGYGFGVIMQRLEKKNINSTPFFMRRMFWLFVFGCLNLALWNGDILHLYAITGVFLLLFRKLNNRSILFCSAFFLFILPTLIRFYQHFFLKFSTDAESLTRSYYETYKFGSLKEVTIMNYKAYPQQWIFTMIEWRDMSEILGRFLLGYYILRRQLLVRLDENIDLFKKIFAWSFVIVVPYIILLILSDEKILDAPRYLLYPFFKIGILATALLFVSAIIQLYVKRKFQWIMDIFRNLGRMTLTNYLVQTILYVIIFYGIGFGLLGEFSFGIIWLCSLTVYFLQGWFSKWWLSKFYYGPVEWIWRQLTYRKRFKLIRTAR